MNDSPNGFGYYRKIWNNRDVYYVGNFREGSYDGFGFMAESVNGKLWLYLGEFEKGNKHGFGIVVFPNAEKS